MPYNKKQFDDLIVEEVADRLIVEPSTVSPDADIGELIDEMLANPIARKVYVVDENGGLMGMVTTETLLRLIGYRVGVRTGTLSFYKFLRDCLKGRVRDVMEAPVFVRPNNKLKDALLKMIEEHMNDIPVVDEDGKLIGELNSLELFTQARILFDQERTSTPDSGRP